MNDPLHPDDDAIELASAYLDGEATATEVARVEGDPDLLAHVERLRAARAELRGTAAPVDPAHRERAIAAALAAFDDTHAADAPEASVTSLIDVAARRTHSSTRTLRIVAVAAAVALIALAVPVLASLGGEDDSDSEAALDVAEEDASIDGGGGAYAEDGDAQSGEPEAAPSAPVAGSADGLGESAVDRATALGYQGDLGAFDDVNELQDAAVAAIGRAAEPGLMESAWESDLAAQCVADTAERLTAEGRAIDLVARARLASEQVAVVVSSDADGSLVTVTDLAGCTLVAESER